MVLHDPQSPSAGGHGSRVFRGACVVLAVAALAQGAAVGMAWKGHHSSALELAATERSPENTGPELAAAATPPAPSLEADPFDPKGAAPVDPHPELAGGAVGDPLLPDPADERGTPPAAPLVAAPLDVPITDEACLNHLDEGVYLRQRGDMQGALKELRQALEKMPDHPKLIYQVALTLDGMGLEARASEQWRRLRLLGQGAGNYYQLAAERLKEGGLIPKPEPAGEEKEGRFVAGAVSVERVPGTDGGETVIVMGKIDRRQPEPAEVAQLGLKLHLFDEVNGQRIDRFFGADPPIEWPDAPVDWAEGSERFVFTVHRAPLSPDELVRMGQRKYYGYALELRYGGGDFQEMKLQDMTAEPAFLAEMAAEIPEGGPVPPAGGEFFDMQDPGGLSDQPDAVLFPGDRIDRQ